mmetsp:Transcript_4225/g.9531  ORF Transcript_4225/g.9531 Transcript_4225/m.9531 type:complete len:94 (+) Transcript_4225:302-583(+)
MIRISERNQKFNNSKIIVKSHLVSIAEVAFAKAMESLATAGVEEAFRFGLQSANAPFFYLGERGDGFPRRRVLLASLDEPFAALDTTHLEDAL